MHGMLRGCRARGAVHSTIHFHATQIPLICIWGTWRWGAQREQLEGGGTTSCPSERGRCGNAMRPAQLGLERRREAEMGSASGLRTGGPGEMRMYR